MIDTRKEPESIELRLKASGLAVKREKLDAGDYCVGNALVERKDINDFWSTLRGGRLWKQLGKLKHSDKRCFLAIIGNYPRRRMRINKKSMEQQIKKLAFIAFISFDVLFTRCETEEQFVEFLKWLWQRSNTKTYAPVVKKGDRSVREIKRDMLSAVDGIGGQLAEELSEISWVDLMAMPDEALHDYKFHNRKLGKRVDKLIQVLKT